MRRLAAPLALAGALAAPAAAAAEDVTVRMPGKFFEPPRLTTVAGDRLTFKNTDLTVHDVRLGASVFDSGPIGRSTQWTQAIEPARRVPVRLHAAPVHGGQPQRRRRDGEGGAGRRAGRRAADRVGPRAAPAPARSRSSAPWRAARGPWSTRPWPRTPAAGTP